jgi:hypothetical protein
MGNHLDTNLALKDSINTHKKQYNPLALYLEVFVWIDSPTTKKF